MGRPAEHFIRKMGVTAVGMNVSHSPQWEIALTKARNKMAIEGFHAPFCLLGSGFGGNGNCLLSASARLASRLWLHFRGSGRGLLQPPGFDRWLKS